MKSFFKWALIAAVTAGAFWLGREATRGLFESATETELADALATAVEEINAQAPLQIDGITTLTSASVSGIDVTYNNQTSVPATELGDDFEVSQKASLKEFICNNSDMMITIAQGGSFTYAYADSDGTAFASIRISKEDCPG